MVETASTEPLPQTLRVLQLSDCHISADPDAVYRGADPREGLRAVLRAAAAFDPQLILATGDLSEDASRASYAWLAEQFQAVGLPVLSLPGNHDDAERQAEVLGDSVVDEPLVRDLPGWRLILLNSAIPGKVAGRLSQSALERLAAALDSGPGSALVLLHHQPVAVGSPWIDRYRLENPEAFWSVIDGFRGRCTVAWGHIHHAVELRRGEAELLGAPATSVNSLPAQQRFTPDPAGPACRWLGLRSDGALSSGVLWAKRGLTPSAAAATE